MTDKIPNKQLVIVGNGFDIAHGLNTSFYDFSKSLPISVKKRWKDVLDEENVSYKDWYDFEKSIDTITMEWFQHYFDEVISDNPNEKYLLNKINNINITFKEITNHLLKYIKNENKKEISIIPNVKKVLNSADNFEVINFNYTTTFTKYSKNKIDYIHGSINEKFIILGYPLRSEHHGISDEATLYKKAKLREKLNFYRFLNNKNIPPKQIAFFLFHFDKQIKRMYSLIGGYNSDSQKEIISSSIQNSNNIIHKKWLKKLESLLNEYSELNNFVPHDIRINVDLNLINTIIILGHSLSSDIEIFEYIFKHAINLEKIILFVYDGENFSEKLHLLSKMSSCKIHLIRYF